MTELAWPIIGTFVLFGIILSFVPQYITFYKTKSSEGISSYFMFVVTFSTFASVLNGIIFYRDIIKDCVTHSVSSLECYSQILGLVQIICLWLCLFVQYVMFMHYLDEYDSQDYLIEHTKPLHATDKRYAMYTFILYVGMTFVLLVIAIAILANNEYDNIAEKYAKVMGLIALIGGTVQYLPQIYKTLKYKIVGSLSIGAMMMQVPGSYILVAFFVWSQDSAHYSTWIPYLVSATLQLILFMICLWIKYVVKPRVNKYSNDYDVNI